MKRHRTLALAAMLLLAAALPALGDAADMSRWSASAPVTLAQQPAKPLAEVELTPELMAIAQPNFADLRLLAPSGAPVPYVLRLGQNMPASAPTPIPVRLFNQVYTPGKQSSVTADLGAGHPRSAISVDTAGTNFRRRVSVEASADGANWQMLRATDWLFRIADEAGTYDKSTVTLPDNDFQYLRITVFGAPDDPEQVPIRGVQAWHQLKSAPDTAEFSPQTTVTQNARLKATEIQIDLGFANLPLFESAPSFSDGTYLRRVEIFGRSAPTRTIVEPVENAAPRSRQVEESWSLLAAASVYQFPAAGDQPAQANSPLSVGGTNRYLLLRIYNGDDPPLAFTGLAARRLRNYLDFRTDPPGPYLLYAGNPDAPAPQYDLAEFADRLRAQGMTPATLGPATSRQRLENPSQPPWSERNTALLWIGLAIGLAVLAALVIRQTKAAKQNP